MKATRHQLWIRQLWMKVGIAVVLWASALVTVSPYDLLVSQAMVDRDSRFGWMISRYGEWPAWAVVLCCVVLLAATRKPGSPWRRHRPMAWAVIFTAVICPGLVVQTLKQLWGRVRFVHIRPDLSDYTPFYIPAGVGAGESFPSGHVAMALVCVPIPVHLHRLGRRRAAWLAWILVILYGLGVAWGRVVWGKHYLTDVVFSFGLGLIGGPIVLHRCAARCAGRGDRDHDGGGDVRP